MVDRFDDGRLAFHHDYLIANRRVRIGFSESRWARLLESELAIYPTSDCKTDPALTVFITAPYENDVSMQNPSNHLEFEDGFTMKQKIGHTRFLFEDGKLKNVTFYVPANRPLGYQTLYRWASMQYLSEQEQIGQAFHEAALIPAISLLSDIAPVHASGIQADSGEITMIGGTGGVGKTSLEMEMCLNHGYSFVADDICILSKSGCMWPNLSYPKIYGYNVDGKPELKEKLIPSHNILDRIHWGLHWLLGKNKVRRRISPKALYNSVSANGGQLGRYIILARADLESIEIKQVTPENAVDLSLDVLQNELDDLITHVLWHGYNRRLKGLLPFVQQEVLLQQWKNAMSAGLSNARCYVVYVPLNMGHVDFKQRMVEFLTST